MAQIARVTTWASGQVLNASDLNGEFNNIINAWNNMDNGTTGLTSPKASALTMNGNITFNPTTAGTVGTTTNDNTSAGNVGQYVSSAVTNVSFPTSGQWGDITSISLTAGDWDVSLVGYAQLNGATCALVEFGIGTATGNSATGLAAGDTLIELLPPTTGADNAGSVAAVRQSLGSTTTIYGKMQGSFTGGPPKMLARISARRVR